MVKWSGGEKTRLGHFTPKVRIFQEVLLNGIRWIVKRPSTKKADSLKGRWRRPPPRIIPGSISHETNPLVERDSVPASVQIVCCE